MNGKLTVGLSAAVLALAALTHTARAQTPPAPSGTPAPGAPSASPADDPQRAALIAAQQARQKAQAERLARGEIVFTEHCQSCHNPPVGRAPSRTDLAANWPDDVVRSLKTGVMQPMAAGLNEQQVSDVAVFLTGREPNAAFNLANEAQNKCAASDKFNAAGPSWNGWSPDNQNTRLAANTTITAADAPKLKVKWAFAYQGGRYGEPSIVGNRVFLTSSSGQAYALNAKTGCVGWSFTAADGAGIRTTVSIGKLAKAPSGYAAYFGDYKRNVYALDANNGKVLWKVNVDDHPRAVLTGAPVLYKDTLYVPLSSWEETTGGTAAYECCKARGAVIAIDAKTGKIKWKQHTLPIEPVPLKKNPAGTQMFGPAGAAVWSAPTIDPKRGVLYVATGDSYTDVKEQYSDALEAMDLKTGKIKWSHQVTENDNFLEGCPQGRPGPNCPTPTGPDHDFGSAPILKRLASGKDLLLAGQKSGQVYAFDPDDNGKILWQTRIGRGSALGGVEWGMAADEERLYVGIADRSMPSLTALNLTDGSQAWQQKSPDPKCSFTGRCGNGYSGPVTIANGVVYGVNQDGHVRAFNAKSGEQIWDYDTAGQKYETVNGVHDQRGGNLDATGIIFAGAMGYLMAGYNGASGASGPDNALLVFSVDGK